jgi:hypothetical protein
LKKAYIAKKGVNALVSKDGHRETKRRTLWWRGPFCEWFADAPDY